MTEVQEMELAPNVFNEIITAKAHVPMVELPFRIISRGMRFPTMWYVRLAKPQTSLRIRAV